MAIVDALRGVAAAAVVWFHLTHMEFRLLRDGPLKESGTYGWAGVEVFFVISGFVLPWSLWRARYSLRSFGRFVARRVVRLDPPYLVSVLLVLALAAAAPLLPAGSTRLPITPTQVALHLGYANVFAGERWLNPVYWTLAIELQWYLLIGLVLPLVASRLGRTRALAIVALCVAALLPDLQAAPLRSLIFPFLGLFVMGLGAFQRRAGLISRRGLALVIVAGATAAAYRVGAIAAATGVVAALLIAEVDAQPAVLLWLGEISYSLYLVHSPISEPFLRYAVLHHLHLLGRLGMMGAAAVASVGAAWVLVRLVERPAQALAGRIRYTRLARAGGAGRLGVVPTPATAGGALG